MVSTGPTARIPAEAPNHADVPSGTRGIRAKAHRVCRASFRVWAEGFFIRAGVFDPRRELHERHSTRSGRAAPPSLTAMRCRVRSPLKNSGGKLGAVQVE
jgi:hypothetical protein